MNRRIKNSWLISAMLAGLTFIFPGRLPAQVFTNLHNFTKTSTSSPYFSNADGANPYSVLALSGTNLYGTANSGGTNGDGSIFQLSVTGNTFSNLHSFTNTVDGNKPLAGLVLAGTNLYGTTEYGGANGAGLVFRINTNGTGLTNLYSFTLPTGPGAAITNFDGAFPYDSLIAGGNFLFGTTAGGGTGGQGSIFRVNLDGTGFTNLHSFAPLTGTLNTNGEGATPRSGLILSGATLYGTALSGGTFGSGTVFAINTNGSSFTNLHNFTVTSGSAATNGDGAFPEAGLLLIGANIYGATEGGGSRGYGNLFSVATNSLGFTNLYNFTNGSDGAYPLGALVSDGSIIYGTAEGGGVAGNGTVFQISTNGKNFTVLHSFTATSGSSASNTDGSLPNAGLTLSASFLYGTTLYGGSAGNGTVYRVALQPLLTLQALSNGKFVLSWPTNYPSFTLQSVTNIVSTNWTTVTPAPVVTGGFYIVTNSPNAVQVFYRLIE